MHYYMSSTLGNEAMSHNALYMVLYYEFYIMRPAKSVMSKSTQVLPNLCTKLFIYRQYQNY